jgi:hypothetical protein
MLSSVDTSQQMYLAILTDEVCPNTKIHLYAVVPQTVSCIPQLDEDDIVFR